MNSIDVFYQGEGIRDITHAEVGAHETFAALRAILVERHGAGTDILIFLEDADEPIDDAVVIREHAGAAGIKAHVHRCRHIEVRVTFNGETVEHRFSPGTTIGRVKVWAAERKFRMSAEEASEHVLQIAGGHDRPSPGTHLGALATCPHCHVAFDLVPDERVNGFPVEKD